MTAAAPLGCCCEEPALTDLFADRLPAPPVPGPFESEALAAAETFEQTVAVAYARLFDWSARAEQAYPPNTLKAWRQDWRAFTDFCGAERLRPLPAAPDTVCAFITHRLAAGKKPATIQRALATVARAHRAAEVDNPCASEAVRLATKAMYRTTSARQRQARGLVWEEIQRFLDLAPRTLRDHRDRALVTTAYDTMCRGEELVALDLEDFAWGSDGTGTALIRRAKNDPEGEGALAYLSPVTVRLLQAWFASAQRSSGAAFRAIAGQQGIRERLKAQAVGGTFKRIGLKIGLPPQVCEGISGHSTRVGATQDLLALNIELPAVMQAGRWKDSRMPMRYGEHVLAKRGGMARAAKEQGRG